MTNPILTTTDRAIAGIDRLIPGERVAAIGRTIALAGVVLPLLLIGILKFTAIEAQALLPLIGGTPWLAWLYPVFGHTGASTLLGVVEVVTAAILIASPWSARAGVIGGALGAATFSVTVSTMLALPIWEAGSGGFPFLDALGSFLIKDVALLGVSVLVLGTLCPADGPGGSEGRSMDRAEADAGHPSARQPNAAAAAPTDHARERSLLLTSAILTLVTAVAGVGIGLFAASRAIVFDGMYTLVDAGMALAAWLIVGLIARGEDRRFQFGYWHLEPMLAFLSGALGFFAVVYAVADAIGGLIAGGRASSYDVGVAFTFGSAIVSFAVFVYVRRKGRGLNSTLLSIEARAWLHSGLMSAALGASFMAALALKAGGRSDVAAYADPVILLLLSLALSPYPIRRLVASGREILQIAPPELDARVLAVVREVAERHGFTGHRSSVTRAGRAQFVEVGFVAASQARAVTFGALDLVRAEVADAIADFAPSCWLTVDFTADRKWL